MRGIVPLLFVWNVFTLNPRHQHPIQDHLHSTVGIILTIINNTWVSPLPLAPTAASYWLWHAATHSLCLPARPSFYLASGLQHPPKALPTIRPCFALIRKVNVDPWSITLVKLFLMDSRVFWVNSRRFRLSPHHTKQDSSNRLFSIISADWVQLKQLKCHFWISHIF